MRNLNVGTLLRKEKTSLKFKPSNEWVLPETTVGIEVELEKVPLDHLDKLMPSDMAGYWEWYKDDSLHDSGAEFSFRVPLFGEDVVQATQGLLSFAKEHKWKPSSRTGIHVHLDARDLPFSQLLGLIGYYIILEPAIFAWVGDGRDCNNFSLPWYKGEGSIADAIRILSGMRRFLMQDDADIRDEIESTCESFHKYAGLNLKSLATYGSIEFRHLKTTLEYSRVREWVNIIMSLKRLAMEAPESTLSIVHGVRRRGLIATLRHCFGEKFIESITPDKMEEVLKITQETSIPNAIELIGVVTQASGNANELLTWSKGLTPVEKMAHQGFDLWRKSNFPKGQEPTEEQIKKAKQITKPEAQQFINTTWANANFTQTGMPALQIRPRFNNDMPVPIIPEPEDSEEEDFIHTGPPEGGFLTVTFDPTLRGPDDLDRGYDDLGKCYLCYDGNWFPRAVNGRWEPLSEDKYPSDTILLRRA